MGFREDFAWGTATSSYQIEGAVKGEGKESTSGMSIQKSRDTCLKAIQEKPPVIITTDIRKM